EVNLAPEQLEKIVAAYGPGSYTGTRIGVTTAKTLAWSLEIPIYLVSSLEVIAANAKLVNGYICPFFDARRKTVFTGLYKSENGKLQRVIEESHVEMNTWLTRLQDLKAEIMFLSPHLASFRNMITTQLESYASIPEHSYHLPRPSNLFFL